MRKLIAKDNGSLDVELLKAAKSDTFEQFMERRGELIKDRKPLDEGLALYKASERIHINPDIYKKRPIKEWYGRIYVVMKEYYFELY